MQTITDRVFKGVTYTSLSRVAVQGMSVLTFFLLVNALTIREYGLLQLLFSVLGPASIITMLGIERLVVADGAVYRAQGAYGAIRRMFKEYAMVASVLIPMVLIAGWLFEKPLSRYFEFDLAIFYVPLALLIVGQLLMNFCTISFEVYERFDLSLFTATGEALMRLVVMIAIVAVGDLTVVTALWAYAAGKACSASGSAFLAVRLLRTATGEAPERSILLAIIRKHGKWEMATKGAAAFIEAAAPWIIVYFAALEGVAFASFAQRTTAFITALVPVRTVMFPILAHSIAVSKELAVRVATKVKKYLLCVYIVLYAVIFVAVEPVTALFAPQYVGAAWLVRITTLQLFIEVFTLGQSVAFYALKQQRLSFMLGVYASVSALASQIIFASLWGTPGFLASRLFVSASGGVIREYILTTRLKYALFTPRALFRFDEDDRRIIGEILARIRRMLSLPMGN